MNVFLLNEIFSEDLGGKLYTKDCDRSPNGARGGYPPAHPTPRSIVVLQTQNPRLAGVDCLRLKISSKLLFLKPDSVASTPDSRIGAPLFDVFLKSVVQGKSIFEILQDLSD